MLRYLISSLFLALVITGCKHFSPIYSNGTPLTSSELSTGHHYSLFKNNLKKPFETVFNDQQLSRLIDVALSDSPNINSARARVLRAQQIAKATYSSLWPSAKLQGYLEKQYFSFNGTVPLDLGEVKINQLAIEDLGLGFNYEFDFWGKNREQFASKLSESFASIMDLQQAKIILIASVASSYVQLQNSILQNRLAYQNLKVLQTLESIVIDRAKQGINSDIPVQTAIINTQSARVNAENFKKAEIIARNKLAALLAKNPFNTRIDTAAFNYAPKQLRLPVIIPANLLAQRPDIVAARSLTESAAHQVNVARAAFFPNINLSGLLSLQSFYFSRFFNISLQTATVKSALELPIFDAGARRARLNMQYANYEIAVNQYNGTIINALQEVKDQLTTIHTLEKQIQNESKALKSAQQNYQLFYARYKAGIIDLVPFLEIKQTLLQQKQLLINLEAQHKQSYIALLAALGGTIIHE